MKKRVVAHCNSVAATYGGTGAPVLTPQEERVAAIISETTAGDGALTGSALPLHLGPWGAGARSRVQRFKRVTRRGPPPLSTIAQRALPWFNDVLSLRYAYVQLCFVNKLPSVSNVIYTPKKANLSQSWLLWFFGEKLQFIPKSYAYPTYIIETIKKLFNEMNKFLFSLVFLWLAMMTAG